MREENKKKKQPGQAALANESSVRPEAGGAVQNDPEKEEDWMKDLKRDLQRGWDSITGMSNETGENAEEDAADEEPEAPEPSKDQLQKELAAMKAELSHTPLVITPELEKLLTEELKAEKRNTKRLTQIFNVLAKHNFYANGLTPAELRTTLEELGPTYVKVGQIMSSRADFLPEEYCKELEKLRQNVKPLDPAITRAVIEAETGKKIEEIYSEFRDEPIGSASIGQVHYGVLKDGTKVVTKVQRPMIAELVQKDFELLKKLKPFFDGEKSQKPDDEGMSFGAIIEEFEKVTNEELDFRVEAANTKFFREKILTDGKATCPAVIDDLTTERIFTMTFVEGCSVAKKDKLLEQGADTLKISREILESYLHQVFDAGIFHADPHQGNIMVSGGKAYWIDFGMIGEITESDIIALENIIVGLLRNDPDGMADGVLAIGKSGEGCDRNRLKDALSQFSTRYMNVSSLGDIDFSSMLRDVVKLAEEHHIIIPGRFTMLVRSFLTIEGVLEQLCPELNLFKITSDKLLERKKKSFNLEKEIMKLGSGFMNVGRKVTQLPQMLAEALTDIMRGRLKINLDVGGYDDLVEEIGNKINDVILVIIGCVLFSGGCRLASTQIQPVLPNGLPMLAVIVLVASCSMIIFALKRIFGKRKK